MIAAGIGCRRGTPVAEIVEVLRLALATHEVEAGSLSVIATVTSKADEVGIRYAAEHYALPLKTFTTAELGQVSDKLLTQSKAVFAATGTPSIAEACALAAAGRNARLLGPRLAAPTATCALATGDGISQEWIDQ